MSARLNLTSRPVQVPSTAGPGPNDPDSVVWLYHSHSNEVNDTNTGLVGGIVVTRAGQANAQGRPKDVQQEFFVMPMVFDENKSRYVQENIKTGLPQFQACLDSETYLGAGT